MNNNTRIYLYNEDGYSLWVLVERLPQLLALLGDPTPPNSKDIEIFYRPSFGRQDIERKLFGEPDLLIGTPNRVYHIESKPKLTSKRRMELELNEAQVLRHRIFQTYRMLWRKYHPSNWVEFREVALQEFVMLFPERTMPEAHNVSSQNLQFILKTFEKCGADVCDALLLFQRSQEANPRLVYTNPHGFKAVVMPLEMIPESNFVAVWMTPPEEC